MKLQKLYLLLSLLLLFTPVKSENEYTFYLGTFDTIDKEGDDEATLYGLEHNNPVLFKDTKVSYSYSHISNNDWGNINPGVNNEIISFTKSF